MSSMTHFILKRATALYSRSHNVTLYDSAEADPAAGRTPKLTVVLRMERDKLGNPSDLTRTLNWAKPIVAAALKTQFR